MKNELLERLRCPLCYYQQNYISYLVENEEYLSCHNCNKKYSFKEEIIDFVEDDTEYKKRNISQWAMEFSPIVRIYENLWRPLVTKPFSDLEWEMNKILELMEVNNCNSVLDIACGTGNFTRLISKKVKNVEAIILGTDISFPMLVEAKRNTENINIMFIRANVLKWPFIEESFERIHCSGALHLFSDIQKVFDSISKSLTKGGFFVCSTYVKKDINFDKRIKSLFEKLTKFHWFEVSELKYAALQAGLSKWEHYINKSGIVFRVEK